MTNPLERLGEQLSRPPEPCLTDEEFAALGPFRKGLLTCNMPGCGKVVSTHHMLCVTHTLEFNKERP